MKEYQIINEDGMIVGTIALPKKSVKIIADMLRIYCKYELTTLDKI